MNQRQYNKPYTPKQHIAKIKRVFSINNRAQADSFGYNFILKVVSNKLLREIKKAGYKTEVKKQNDRYILKIEGRKSVKMEVVR